MKGIALALDGSTYSPSAALLRDGALIAEFRIDSTAAGGKSGRGEQLVPGIAEMLESKSLSAGGIETVICGAGPGSFTSLRIAASVAKGIAFVSGAKLYAVSSLLLSFGGVEDGSYLSVLPAMRGELFALPVSVAGRTPVAAARTHSIIREDAVTAAAKRFNARVIGPGREVDAEPNACEAARLYEAIISAGTVDLNSWEPDYGRLAEAQVKWEASRGRPLRT